jgi:hypothetical protein
MILLELPAGPSAPIDRTVDVAGPDVRARRAAGSPASSLPCAVTLTAPAYPAASARSLADVHPVRIPADPSPAAPPPGPAAAAPPGVVATSTPGATAAPAPSSGAAEAPTPASSPDASPSFTADDLTHGETDPREVLRQTLRIEMRPAGLRDLGRALMALRKAVPAGMQPPARDADPFARARLDALEQAAIAQATPIELALTLKALLEPDPVSAPQAPSFIPRKRVLIGEGLETRTVMPPPPAQAPQPDPAATATQARVLLDLGRLYSAANNQPAAFQMFSAAMRLSYDAWLEQAPVLNEAFQRSAVFQALSGQKASEVVALFEEYPLDRKDLARRIVAQIERRLSAYAAADRRFVRQPDLAAAVGDLLHTMVEDPDFARLIPRDEYQRILERIGKVALEREFNAEALGALSAAGNVKQLTALGRRWSKTVVLRTDRSWIVNRDLELAITAFTEAKDFNALRGLLERCRQAQLTLAGSDLPVEGAIHLDRYIARLANLLEGDGTPLSASR